MTAKTKFIRKKEHNIIVRKQYKVPIKGISASIKSNNS